MQPKNSEGLPFIGLPKQRLLQLSHPGNAVPAVLEYSLL